MNLKKKTGQTQAPPNLQSSHISLVRRIGRFFSALMRRILSPGKTHFSLSAPVVGDYRVASGAGTVKGRFIQKKDSLKIELNAVQAPPPQGWVRTVELISASKISMSR